jgi:hypothetical protein
MAGVTPGPMRRQDGSGHRRHRRDRQVHRHRPSRDGCPGGHHRPRHLTHLSDRPLCLGCLVRLELQGAAQDAAMPQVR